MKRGTLFFSKSPLLAALLAGLGLTACSDAESPESFGPDELRELDDGLLLHWTFEDNVGMQITDVSGNGRHGTRQGGVGLQPSPNGQAALLDGIDDWISMTSPPRSPALYGGADGSFTFSARIKVTNTGKYNTLCAGCGPFSTLYVGTEPYGAALLSALDDQASSAWKWLTSSPTLVADTWTEVTLVVENGGNARYYLDCELDAQLSDANLGLIDVGSSSIGKSTIASRWFGGQIDELRVWDRALTDTELAELCPAPVEPDPLTLGLEMHWTFEDRIANQITDLSGKGRTGTVVGGSFVASPKGEALSLDGIDDKVTFVGPRAPALYGGVQGDFTFSASVRVPNVTKYNTLCVGCGPFSSMYIGDPAPGARVLSGLWNLDTATTAWAVSSSTLTNDVWTEVTLVVEGGVAARTYENCNLDSTLAGVNVGLRDSGFSALGQGSVANRWYQGEVDELRVWSRALPDEEIALLCDHTLCEGPIYVDVDAPAGGDGLAWATAFDDLQDAIDASAACTSPQLWVAEGQYAPAQNVFQVATIRHDVEIYGGFAGNEVLLSQRDIVAHPVRLGADGWQNYVVEIEDATSGPEVDYTSVRLDGLTISGSLDGGIHVDANAWGDREVLLENLTLTDHVDNAALSTSAGNIHVTVRNSSFERNHIGAIYLRYGATLVVEDSSFIENTGVYGSAIYLMDPVFGPVTITNTVFRDNSAQWGGAIFIDDNDLNPLHVDLTISGGEFDSNVATAGGGGAIYAEESTTSFDSVVFTDNTAKFGGAIHLANPSANAVSDEMVISNCRFIGNRALAGSGGALRLQEVGTRVVNTEFTGNQASTVGGAVWGRGEFIASTFTNNVAGSGSALYAPAGPDMIMQHCVVYPDTIFGTNIHGQYSCTKSANLLDAPQTLLTNVTPFESADFDLDGRTEWYLDPEGPCTGLANGAIDEFDWTSLTVDPSQCTDAGWPEPGVHYEPQSAVGACASP